MAPCDWYVYIIKHMYCSKNSELKITLFLSNLSVNIKCQQRQHNVVGLFEKSCIFCPSETDRVHWSEINLMSFLCYIRNLVSDVR